MISAQLNKKKQWDLLYPQNTGVAPYLSKHQIIITYRLQEHGFIQPAVNQESNFLTYEFNEFDLFAEKEAFLYATLLAKMLKRVLILPQFTRFHSDPSSITNPSNLFNISVFFLSFYLWLFVVFFPSFHSL